MHQVAKLLELRFSISPFKGSSGLISLRIDWLYLLAVQGTLKSLLQHYSSKASILQCSSFFIVQLSHPYMTTGKIIALMRRTFVGKLEVRISIYQLEGGDTKHLVFFFFLTTPNGMQDLSSPTRGGARTFCSGSIVS